MRVLCFSEAMKKILISTLLFGWDAMAGYNLHIEREREISESEWSTICENDKSLAVQDSFSVKNPDTGEHIEISSPNSCVWTTPILKKKFYFTYSSGRITFSYDKAAIKKAKKIATQLNAKVGGDEGEAY